MKTGDEGDADKYLLTIVW